MLIFFNKRSYMFIGHSRRQTGSRSAATKSDQNLQTVLLPQMDRATRYASQNLVNCRNKLYDKSRTVEVIESEGYR